MRRSSIVITAALASGFGFGAYGAAFAQTSSGTNATGAGASGVNGDAGTSGSRNSDAGTGGPTGNNMSGVSPTPSRSGGNNTGGTDTKPTAGVQ